MATTKNLIAILKKELRNHGITYATVGNHLQLSEATIKAMFARKNFTLERLDKICELINTDITGLAFLFEQAQNIISHLTLEQEKQLVSDTKFLLTAICVYNHLSLDNIVAKYKISELSCIQYFAKLDKLRLIELLPKNHYRLRVSKDFRWLANGPIQRFFDESAQEEFFRSRFLKPHESKQFLSGLMSQASCDTIHKKLSDIAKDFAILHKNDCTLPHTERKPYGVMLASRIWEFSVFEDLQR